MGDFLDLGGSEVVETTESFWRDTERLRRTGERLKMKAAMSDPRYELMGRDYAPKPQMHGIETMMARRIDEPYDVEAEAREARTRAAFVEIMRATENERKAAEQQQQQDRMRAHAEFRATPLGGLLTRRV